ncbi:MAG: hypothetical protein Q9159_006205 [Coniocarpon cinnabarinum]
MERRPASARPLPSLNSLKSSTRWLRTLPIFIAIVSISALGLFNYQKLNSPVLSANLYSLRTNPTVRELLGEEVYFAQKFPWVWGTINLVQGRVDVEFEVAGKRQRGWCRFVARRTGGRGGSWGTETWTLKVGEKTVDLLEVEGGGDPMAGAEF